MYHEIKTLLIENRRMERWSGKTAVVTGAGGGIGSATALVLANAGFRVVGIDRQAEMVKVSVQSIPKSPFLH